MTMENKKFTKEQYEEIVRVQEREFGETISAFSESGDTLYGAVGLTLATFVDKNNLSNELMALANPVTRDWAKERFVEKEKLYFWNYKKKDDEGYAFGLQKSDGLIRLTVINFTALTESEVIEAGYNPEMFEKEEVE